MRTVYRSRKPVAALLLLIFSVSTFFPGTAYALTSGPDQPEMKGFQPIGLNDMVDVFSGDFKYNLPVFDVGGYALNLSYNGGQSMDDESSWVGYGWSLNPGTINRQLRGIPDDFNGKGPTGDVIEKQVAMKPFISKSISPVVKLKRKGKKFPGAFPFKVDLGISSNNYTGVKAELGFSASLSLTKFLGTSSTLNLGVKTDNQDGGSFNGGLNFSLLGKNKENREWNLGGSIGFDYNATRGIEGLTLGTTFAKNNSKTYRNVFDLSGSEFISFAGESYIPAVEVPQRTKTFSYGLRGGVTAFGFTGLLGVSGSYSKQDIASSDMKRFYPAYGMMNEWEGRNNNSALMDFNRENDKPYHPKLPYLPVPVINQDLFSVTSQNASGQYKISTSSSGIMADNNMKSKSTKFGFGLELGFGWNFHAGISDLSYNQTTNKSGKWTNSNDFRTNGEFVNTSASNPLVPEAYFKKVGETSLNDNSFTARTGEKEATAVQLRNDGVAKTFGKGTALNKLRSKSGKEFTSQLKKDGQDKRNETLSYLRAGEAMYYGLDKDIRSYPLNTIVVKGCNENLVTSIPRVNSATGRLPQHLSEMTLTDQQGTRQVYGIQGYNMRQDEVSFSVAADETARQKGLIRYNPLDDSIPTSDGDPRMTSKNYIYNFNKQRLRGYATSYMLTAILSPDYVDATNNGISDDDPGSAVKFNYSKLGDYKWRTPFFNLAGIPDRVANYNEGLLSDKKDDKASYVYGEKEQWYLHSIESKTMLAIFILQDRNDGLGVNNSDGSLNSSFKLKSLKEIRLYSKADLYRNSGNFDLTTPVKVAHFEYNYELFNNVPNSLSQGKLTLKKVWFTFYKNGQGKLHPYTFNYNIPAYQDYQFRQYDRWGMYKPADSCNLNGLNNAEFPYSTQDKTKADRWAGYWQLSQITLPTGGTINVTYESDDYAYVQNKRSAIMCFMRGVGGYNQNTNITSTNTIYIDLPRSVANVQELKMRYFEGMEYLYFKSFIDLDNKNINYEYIPGYGKIELIELYNSTTAKVTVSKVNGYNPISKAAWQILQGSLPKLAYSDYDNLDSDESDFVKAVRAMISAISRISDIVRSFDSRASGKGFASRINLNKSWVRLCNPDFKKLGGGSRVKKITMSDKWSEMTGSVNTESSTYGQVYYYTTEKTLSNGTVETISSGVASYEPQVGADENPFKLPVQYTQKRFLGLDQHYYIEQPLGESYFPAASVGYSKVVMKNIGADGVEGSSGNTTSEFFTAKDFPTRVEATDLQRVQPKLRKILRLFSIKMTDHATVSQGYVVENYNMHGKPKSEKILDKNGQEISATLYEYRTENKYSGKTILNNIVPVMNRDGLISQGTVGVDYDFFTDMNEHSTENFGAAGEPSGGFYMLGIFPRVWFYWGGFSPNYDKRLFRSSVAIKSINSFPIIDKVIKREKGSSIETQNLLWDGETGDVLLTQSQNEFDDPVYSFNYPAYWAHDGMGPAYKNQGLYLANFTSDANGVLSNYGTSVLTPGDELVVVTDVPANAKKYWIIKATDNTLRIVDENGVVSAVSNQLIKILRSGRKNLSSSSMGTVMSLKNPMVSGKLRFDSYTQVLQASAAVYNEEWVLPVRLKCATACPPGYTQSNGFCYGNFQNPTNCGTYTLTTKTAVEYSSYGSKIYNTGYSTNGSGTFTTFGSPSNTYWFCNNNTTQGPMNRCGVWTCSPNNPANIWVGYSTRITAPESKTYYLGLGGDNFARFKVDGQLIVEFGNPAPNGGYYAENFKYWHIYPITLSAGTHFIEIAGKNEPNSIASFGCEVYNNTATEIMNSTSGAPPNLLFSTRWLWQPPIASCARSSNTYDNGSCRTCPIGYAYDPTDNRCYQVAASDPNINTFNPYRTGILGNWHSVRSYNYDAIRANLIIDPAVLSSTNIRKAGFFNTFAPYWISASSNFVTNNSNSYFSKWIWGNELTTVNLRGMETENRDALLQYSAAQTGYLETLPVAIASNSRLRDLAYDGFEDYDLYLQCNADTCKTFKGHFNFRTMINGSTIMVDSNYSHTGKYSLRLNVGGTLSRPIYGPSEVLYNRDSKQQFSLQTNYPMLGFSPGLAGQQYVLSFWVKESSLGGVYPSVNVSVNGSTIIYAGITKATAVVEGWKRVETVFTMPGAPSFDLNFSPASTVYIDDIRIHPYNSMVKSYVYDPASMRLVAELDENNMATIYEYDDEGVLIRLKKETEKGLVTLRESRSGIKRTP